MEIFRVKKTRDYSVMSNYHLRDPNLSLAAKGLLTIMLSLLDTGGFSIREMTAFCREDIDTIKTVFHELERAGYVGTEYTIYERPKGENS